MTTTDAVRAWLLARLGPVDPDRPLNETGLSSRDATALAADLGQFVGRPLDVTLVWQYPTISALAAHLSTGESSPVALLPDAVDEPIAVVGLGCRLPGGIDSPEAFWRFLEAGGDGIGDVPEGRWETFAPASDLAGLPLRGGFLDDVAGFDAEFFGITPREASAMDPQQRLLLEVAWAALEHAGIPPSGLRGSRTGVFVGLSATEYSSLTMTDVGGVDVWSGTGAAASIAANRLSYLLDLRGPSLTLDTACSSSLVAVHQAVQSLRSGESELALAAGVNVLLSPGITAGFHRAGVLAADGHCKPFDAGADGIARGEGCGVVVLKPLRAARRAGDRVLAVLRGSAVNSDGRSNGMTAPNPLAQADLLRSAYAAAGVDPSSVDYVEAHGTGTPLGDPLEAGALSAVLGREAGRPLLLGSVKSNLGHLEGAAGIAGLLKVVLAMTHRRLPPSLHFREPNPHIDFTGLRVVTSGTDWPRYSGTARAGVSAFGFGGTNAHVVVEEWPAASFPVRVDGVEGPSVFALSARSAEVVRARAAELAEWVERSSVPLAAVASTLAHRREHLPVRGAVVGESREEVVAGLRELAAGGGLYGQGSVGGLPRLVVSEKQCSNPVSHSRPATGEPEVVFVFSGYGSQWSGMGRRFLGSEPAFRAEVEALDPAFRAETGASLRDLLEREPGDLATTQLALFGMQLALAALWRAHGVTPAAVLGHSMGEVAAAVVAGALDVRDGLRVMATRARLLAELDRSGEGAMAVVELSPAELADFPEVTVAVYASPTQCTVSGAADQVDALVEHAEREGRLARRLAVGGAGHSAAVDAVLDRFRGEIGTIRPGKPEIPCYTTVLDDPRETPAFDVGYWAANLRRPVRFSQALTAAADDGHTVFVEVSPHPVALAAVEQTTGEHALPSASRRIDERAAFLTSLARLHVRGHRGALDARPRTAPVDLPGPVWRHERFWPKRRTHAHGGHPLLGVHIEHPDGHLWRGDVGTEALPWLADHTVRGTPVFPATGFLELALAAARTGRIRDLELREVLTLGEHTEVTTSLTGTEFGVHAKSANGEWVRHATARIDSDGTPVTPLGEVTGEPLDLYRVLADLGQDYGPAFRGLRRVTAAGGRASASIALPDADHPAYLLHPALADACLHALAAAVGDADALYLPLTIGEVVLAGEPRRGVRVDAALTSKDPSGDGLLGSVQLVDADDVVLVEFRDVYCRRFRDAALDRLLFEATWQPVDLPGSPERAEHWIVLSEVDDDLGTARLGDRAALTGLLREGDVTAVVVLLGGEDTPDPGRAAARVGTLSEVVAELAELPAPPRLWLVTAGAQSVEPGERGDPDLAALRGLVRVLAFEHPELRVSVLDFDAGPDPARLWVGQLRDEVRADGPDDEVAWREGVRHVRRLGRPEPADAVREPVRDGAYVITGGLGGLGLVAAKWLADRGATRVVLNSRRAAPAPDLGIDVRVVPGDIAGPGTAEALVAAAVDGGVPLRGVLHAAGVLADGAAISLDTGALDTVWRPKAQGAWRLHEATAGNDLDWWLVYSSAAALFGSPGQAAYATANAWADALVAWRRAQGLPAATIGWGVWGEVGAAAGSRNPVLEPLGTGEALSALDVVLARDRAATGVARVDAETVLELFPRLADRPFFGLFTPRTGPSTWDGLDTVRTRSPEIARKAIADHLAGIIAGLLGYAEVERDVPLTRLGLDSLSAMRARGAVERDFGLPLPIPLLLRGASLAELAGHLAEQAGFGTAKAEAVTAGPRDPAERWVARHWRAELGGPEPGVHDDFFAVGGDPGHARRLRAVFAEQLGAVPAVERLFATPTVAAIADLLRAELEGHGGGPVRLLRDGVGEPVFLFHPAGGPTSVYRELVRLLPEGQPVYGFERIDDEDTVEAKAACYVELIREIQPQGPYRLGGWSFGGCLAYETARRLDGPVDLVFLIDTILPLPAPGKPADLLLDRFDRFAEHVSRTYGVPFAIPRDTLAGLDEHAQIRWVMDSLAETVPDLGAGVLRHQYESYVDARVAERYAPERYDGRVLLLRARDPHPLTTTLDPRYLRTDDTLGWDEYCPGLEVARVPGDHVSMIDPPHVTALAAELAARLGVGVR